MPENNESVAIPAEIIEETITNVLQRVHVETTVEMEESDDQMFETT